MLGILILFHVPAADAGLLHQHKGLSPLAASRLLWRALCCQALRRLLRQLRGTTARGSA